MMTMCTCGFDPCMCLQEMMARQYMQNMQNVQQSFLQNTFYQPLYVGGLGSPQQLPEQALRSIYGLSVAMTAPEPLENAGIKVEDLIGWRIWFLTPSGMLQSYSTGHLWKPGVPMEGDPGDHDSYGIWAFKDEAAAAAKLHVNTRHVMGRVRLWGDVVEHEDGYRAQFARIISLDAVHIANSFPWHRKNRVALFWLRHRYGIKPDAQR